MADWWKTAAWPWMKKNWWAVLLAPLALVIFILMVAAKFATRVPVGIIDPLADADERADEEESTRTHQLAAENTRLSFALDDIRTKHAALQENLEQRVRDEVQVLRDDPQQLRALMLGIGPGTKPDK